MRRWSTPHPRPLSLQERGVARGSRRFADGGDDGVAVVEHQLIAEADHDEAVALDLLRPRRIVLPLAIVLPAVEFDDQLALEAEEIDGVGEERNLTAEFEAVETAAAQEIP